jgi:two-component system response regulator HydG
MAELQTGTSGGGFFGVDSAKDEKPDLKSAALGAEYDLIIKVLKEVNYNKSKAASILNIDRKTLYNKMKAYNM